MQTDDQLKIFLKDNVLFTSDVAEILQVSRQRVNELAKNNQLVPFKKGQQGNLYLRRDVENYLSGLSSRGTRLSGPKFLDDTSGTHNSVDYFRRHIKDFGEIESIFIFFDHVDAAHEGFFLPTGDFFGKLEHIHVPTFILRNCAGEEMWLNGCNCGYGGAGPNGSVRVLLECGFSDREYLERAIFGNRIVRFIRRSDGEFDLIASDDGRFKSMSRDLDYGSANLYLSNGSLVLLESSDRYNSKSVHVLDRFRAFLPNPVELIVYSREQAIEMGYTRRTPLFHRDIVYRVVIRNASGREIWLSPYLQDDEPISKQKELRSILEACGFEIPKTGLAEDLKWWMSSFLRKGAPMEQPIRITQRSKVTI